MFIEYKVAASGLVGTRAIQRLECENRAEDAFYRTKSVCGFKLQTLELATRSSPDPSIAGPKRSRRDLQLRSICSSYGHSINLFMDAFHLLSRGGVNFDKRRFKTDVDLFSVILFSPILYLS